MNRQFASCLLLMSLCASVSANDLETNQAAAQQAASISIATKSLELTQKVSRLAHRRLQKSEEDISAELAEITASKYEQLVSNSE